MPLQEEKIIDGNRFYRFQNLAVFNFAYSAIVCGMLALLIHVLFHVPEKEEEDKE